VVLPLRMRGRISCTPSCSVGRKEVHKEGLTENHTALANEQWKNK